MNNKAKQSSTATKREAEKRPNKQRTTLGPARRQEWRKSNENRAKKMVAVCSFVLTLWMLCIQSQPMHQVGFARTGKKSPKHFCFFFLHYIVNSILLYICFVVVARNHLAWCAPTKFVEIRIYRCSPSTYKMHTKLTPIFTWNGHAINGNCSQFRFGAFLFVLLCPCTDFNWSDNFLPCTKSYSTAASIQTPIVLLCHT